MRIALINLSAVIISFHKKIQMSALVVDMI